MVNMWQMILSSLQHKVNRQSFNTWLKPTRQLSFAEGTLNVEVPSLLFADWISRHYLALIEESAKEVDGSPVQFRFTSRQPAAAHATAISEPPPAAVGRPSVGGQTNVETRPPVMPPGIAGARGPARPGTAQEPPPIFPIGA